MEEEEEEWEVKGEEDEEGEVKEEEEKKQEAKIRRINLLSLTDFTNLISRANYAAQDHYLTIQANFKVHSKLTLP